jgi:alanine racemase
VLHVHGLDALLALPGRSTRALVDLDVLGRNVHRLKAHVGDAVELMAVVKADGYGHGAVMVAREAVDAGATWLGVATVAEGRELRSAGLDVPTLVLGPIDASELDAAVDDLLDVTVGDESLVEAVIHRASAARRVPRLHLKVDTGMHRYGLSPELGIEALRRLESSAPRVVHAISSQFASADMPEDAATVSQHRLFRELARCAREVRPDLAIHVANSSATVAGFAADTSIVRTGIAMYGCGVSDVQRAMVGDEQAMSVVSRLMRVHELDPGDGVSYGHTYVATSPERVGLVPIGYADGYHRALSNRSWMSLDGLRVPVRGRVCMDQTVVGDMPASARTGDWVGVAGPALGGPSWDDLAANAGTIGYDLLTSVGRRVARVYHRSGRLVAARDELGRLHVMDDNNEAPTA